MATFLTEVRPPHPHVGRHEERDEEDHEGNEEDELGMGHGLALDLPNEYLMTNHGSSFKRLGHD
jgi:hypothetical protein